LILALDSGSTIKVAESIEDQTSNGIGSILSMKIVEDGFMADASSLNTVPFPYAPPPQVVP
jgi:hypothetical protein